MAMKGVFLFGLLLLAGALDSWGVAARRAVREGE